MKPTALPPTPGAPVALEPELGPEALPDETLLEQPAPTRATTAISAGTTLRALMPEVPPPWLVVISAGRYRTGAFASVRIRPSGAACSRLRERNTSSRTVMT